MHIPRQPIASLLLHASSSLDEPVAIWEKVQSRLAEGWQPVSDAELRALYRDVCIVGRSDLGAAGQPRQYRWSLGLSLATFDRALSNRRHLHLVELTDSVGHLLTTYRWNMGTLGHDPYRNVRARMLDVMSRLMMEVAEHDSLAWVLDGPAPNTPQSSPAVLVRNLRHLKGLSQADLAQQIGVSRSTVERWETGQTRPQPSQRERLADILGGVPGDYA